MNTAHCGHPNFSWPSLAAAGQSGFVSTAALEESRPLDLHVLEQMLRALHQDDAVEGGVLTHHAAGAISAHHKLQ